MKTFNCYLDIRKYANDQLACMCCPESYAIDFDELVEVCTERLAKNLYKAGFEYGNDMPTDWEEDKFCCFALIADYEVVGA